MIQLPKGTKDITSEEKFLRDKVINIIKSVFELYGFIPLETPILERYEILTSKYAGGSEILKETFKLKDQGNRKLGLRYDLTVPLARFAAMNPQIKMPFKRYQIGQVFRDGPVSSTRIREFTQCDTDTIGSKSMLADAEIIALTNDIFKKLNLSIIIKINNRKILNALLEELNTKNKEAVILSIDKLDKISELEVKKELISKKISKDKATKILKLTKSKKLKLKNNIGLKELDEVLKYLKLFNVKNIKIDYSLARGLPYYTSTIFEVFLKNSKEAIAAGGRYDKLIGSFIGKEIPAVGISFGLDRIIKEYKDKTIKTKTLVYIIPINTLKESIKILNELRKNNINSDIDLLNRNISKNLDYADKLKIPYVLFIGLKELKNKKVKLRDMKTGKERLLDLKQLIKILE